MASKLVLRKELRPIGAMGGGGGVKFSVLIEAYLQPCISDNLIRTCIGEDDCQKPQKYEEQKRHECSELTISTLTPRLLPSPSHQDFYHPHTKTPPFILTLNSSLHPHTKTPITLTPRLLPSPSHRLLSSPSHQDSVAHHVMNTHKMYMTSYLREILSMPLQCIAFPIPFRKVFNL